MKLMNPVKPVKPLLLVVGSSDQAWREYMMASLADRCRLHLFSATAPTWETPYLAGHDLVDTLDSNAMIDIASRHRERFAGVITYWETRVVAVAEIALAFGLTASPVAAVRACRDKYLGRQLLKAAGVPQADSLAIASLDEARAAASQIGFPVVIKPRALSSSSGVMLARTPAEVAVAYQHASLAWFAGVPSYPQPILVEEYLDGPEISVDSVCRDGYVTPLFIARKRLGFPPAFEETGHIVWADDPLFADEAVREVLQDAHTALGLTAAMTHTELRLTRTGPKVVEVNARTGGGLIPYLGQIATGIDLGLVAADLATGADPDLRLAKKSVAGVRFLYPEHDLSVTSVTVDRGRLPAKVKDVRVLASPGQQLRLPPRDTVHCRYAAIIAQGRTMAQCSAALDRAAEAVAIHGTPLDDDASHPKPACDARMDRARN